MATSTISMDESNKKTTFSLTLPEGWTISNNYSYRLGNLVFIGGVLAKTESSTLKRFAFPDCIPNEYKPLSRIDFACNNNTSDTVLHGIISGRLIDFYRNETTPLVSIGFSVIYSVV